jgi:hypothetical protein
MIPETQHLIDKISISEVDCKKPHPQDSKKHLNYVAYYLIATVCAVGLAIYGAFASNMSCVVSSIILQVFAHNLVMERKVDDMKKELEDLRKNFFLLKVEQAPEINRVFKN